MLVYACISPSEPNRIRKCMIASTNLAHQLSPLGSLDHLRKQCDTSLYRPPTFTYHQICMQMHVWNQPKMCAELLQLRSFSVQSP
jgi:hypothetical protein